MTQQVNINDEIHEFPDEATPEMIQSALSKEIQNQKIKSVIDNDIIGRPFKRAGEDIWSLAKNIGNTVRAGVPSVLNQLTTNPGQLSKNLLAGGVGIPINLVNTAFNLPA